MSTYGGCRELAVEVVWVLRVGFAEVDITPEPGKPMAGMYGSPRATGVHWPLHTRVALFDDGSRRVAVVTLDLLFLLSSTVAELRQTVAEQADVQPDDVLVACSHTHRAPHTTSLGEEDADFGYLGAVRQRVGEATTRAAVALRPARLRVGSVPAPGWTFNRRPVYRGNQVGTQGPHWVEDFVRVEGPADDELQVMVATDEDGRVLGGLVDFACHTTVMGGEPVYSADFVGPLLEELSARHGGVFGFLQGASGQLWAYDMSRPLSGRLGGPEYAERMGTALADRADEALRDGRELEAPRVRAESRWLEIPQRRPSREQVRLARWYLEEAPDDVDEQAFGRQLYGHDYTFYDAGPGVERRFARELIGMWEWQRRTGAREPRDHVEVQAMTIGDVAFAGYPCELFTEFGLRTKHESPFPTTFVVELANGWFGYVPTPQAFDHGGYEPRFAYASRLIPPAGDQMTDAVLELLRAAESAAT